jgi:homoserine O-acetyltransferase/O-succinyltransferase
MSQFTVSPLTQHWRSESALVLESGERIGNLQIAYRTWGALNDDASNAVIVCHALTGSADADDWWADLFGEDNVLDPKRDFIVCSNALGGCYGSSGPTALHPDGEVWSARFPQVTIRDQVNAQRLLADALGVRRIRKVIGGSMGALQALEWALLDARVEQVIAIAGNARHSAWCLLWSEAQRQAIQSDPKFNEGHYRKDDPPSAGLSTARAIAMATYRSASSINQRFDRDTNQAHFAHKAKDPHDFAARSWLRYHGESLNARFDANSYLRLINAMDTHDVGRDRDGWQAALASIDKDVLIVTIPSDVLYPSTDQFELLEYLPRGRLATLTSAHGHDGFLIDAKKLAQLLIRHDSPNYSTLPSRRSQRAVQP